MDWKALGNIAALVGVLVAMAVMFNQVNGRLDRMQAESNRRFDDMDRRFDQLFRHRRIAGGCGGQRSMDSRPLQDWPFALSCLLNQPPMSLSHSLAWDVIRVGNAISIETRFSRGRPQGTWRLKKNGARTQ